MALEGSRPLTQTECLDGKLFPPNDLSPAPDNTTISLIPHPTSTFQKDTAASRNRNRRDADVDSEGRTTASAKEARIAPRRLGRRHNFARPEPPATEVGKLARKRRISDVDDTQSGPTTGSLQR